MARAGLPGSTMALPWRVTYEYTTDNISGTVGGTARYFASETEALHWYLHLREGNGSNNPNEQVVGNKTKLWRAAEWEQVL